MSNQIGFQGRKVWLGFNPRIGVCNGCRAVVPFDCDRTEMHHEEYDPDNILSHTIEYCRGCHGITRRKEQKKKAHLIRVPYSAYLKIQVLQNPRETYDDVINRAIDYYLEKEHKQRHG
jgi:hypothetical protein